MISSTQLLGSPKTIRFSASRSIVSRPGGRLTIGWGHRKYILSNGSGNSPRSLRPVAQPLYARGDAAAVFLMWFFNADCTLWYAAHTSHRHCSDYDPKNKYHLA